MRKNILERSELWRWLWSKTRVYVDHMHVSNKWGCGVVMVRWRPWVIPSTMRMRVSERGQ